MTICPVKTGSSCILVGNGPSLLVGNHGPIIDQFDEVVRFNKYITRGLEPHTGSKTTIWSTFGRGTMPGDGSRPGRVIYVHGESGGPPYQPNELYRIPWKYFVSKRLEIRQRSSSPHAETLLPSSGYLVTSWLLDCGVPHLSLVGFDHFRKDWTGKHHYWDTRSFKKPREHDGECEAELIGERVAAGRVTVLQPSDLDWGRELERQKYLSLRQTRPRYGSTCHGRSAIDHVMGWNPSIVVDFGCGGNEFIEMVRERGGDGCGIDFANEKADVIAPMHKTGLDDSCADVVTAFDSLEHVLPEDVDGVLREMRRVGKPGGRFVFSISTVPSRITVDGRNLHPTVQPIGWWLNRIRRHGSARVQRGYVFGQWSNWKP